MEGLESNEYQLITDKRISYIFLSKLILSFLLIILYFIFNENCICSWSIYFIITNIFCVIFFICLCFYDINVIKRMISNLNDNELINLKYNGIIYCILVAYLLPCRVSSSIYLLILLFAFCVSSCHSYIEYTFFVKYQ